MPLPRHIKIFICFKKNDSYQSEWSYLWVGSYWTYTCLISYLISLGNMTTVFNITKCLDSLELYVKSLKERSNHEFGFVCENYVVFGIFWHHALSISNSQDKGFETPISSIRSLSYVLIAWFRFLLICANVVGVFGERQSLHMVWLNSLQFWSHF